MNANTNKEQFLKTLDKRDREGNPIQFWWRDDDAFQTSQNLERLINLAEFHNVPFALAVIPKNATRELAERISKSPNITVLTHGYSHRNHANSDAGQLASEFGEYRPINESLQDLNKGYKRIIELFGKQSLPILAPPWNRVGSQFLNRISEVDLKGFSGFGSLTEVKSGSHQMDVHWDPIKWGNSPCFCGESKAWKKLNEELFRRKEHKNAPIGIMTHHLVHDEDTWNFLNELLTLATDHPGAHFPELRTVFGFE